eukprot:8666495-Karenia_brevis.AAC.1
MLDQVVSKLGQVGAKLRGEAGVQLGQVGSNLKPIWALGPNSLQMKTKRAVDANMKRLSKVVYLSHFLA